MASTAPALRVALADDSVLLREGLVRLLAALPSLTVDAVVLDVRMPPTFRDEGVRAAVRIRREFPAIAVLLLS
jgi:DNA-binding NarL/FixJ family response regulator